jgi:hypothetical protein
MCIRRETQEKARRSLAFSPVSKPHTHITYMLRQCTRIVYISLSTSNPVADLEGGVRPPPPELLTPNTYMNQRTQPTCIYDV